MPVLIVQLGHCYRTTGATGTEGEQKFATTVGQACTRLLNGRGGWSVRPVLADSTIYRGDAFVAVHCDGSTNSTARGASVGYRTLQGQQFGQAWKRAYAARGWPVFRPDNYTAALAGYYGVRRAVAAGTHRAIVIEAGFLTNPTDRLILTGPGGAERVALAIGDALGIPHSWDEDTSDETDDNGTEDSMQLILMRGDQSPATYLVKIDTEVWAGDHRLEFGAANGEFAGNPHVAVRTYVPGPPYGQALLMSMPLKVVPQAALDAIPKTEGSQ